MTSRSRRSTRYLGRITMAQLDAAGAARCGCLTPQPSPGSPCCSTCGAPIPEVVS